MTAPRATPLVTPLVPQHDTARPLLAWAIARVGAPLVWGEADCLALALEALAVETGRDVQELRAAVGLHYTTRLGALRLQHTLATAPGGLAAAWSALGLRAVAAPLARTGDLLLTPSPDGRGLLALGVVCDARVLTVGHDGAGVLWELRPTRAALEAAGTIALRLPYPHEARLAPPCQVEVPRG